MFLSGIYCEGSNFIFATCIKIRKFPRIILHTSTSLRELKYAEKGVAGETNDFYYVALSKTKSISATAQLSPAESSSKDVF